MEQKLPQCASVLCVAASPDHVLLRQWEKHLRPLEQAGHLTIWSELHLLPGESRQEKMAEHLTQANLIVLLLSPDFFDSEECYTLMQSALQRHYSGQACVVPLLLRSVVWDESPLRRLSSLPTNGKPITHWRSRDAAFQNSVERIRSLLDLPTIATSAHSQTQTSSLLQGQLPSKPRPSQSQRILQVLWRWTYVLRIQENRFARQVKDHLKALFFFVAIVFSLCLILLNFSISTPFLIHYWFLALIPTCLVLLFFVRLYFVTPAPPVPTRLHLKRSRLSHLKYALRMILYGIAILSLLFSGTSMILSHVKPNWCPPVLCLFPLPTSSMDFNSEALSIALANSPQTFFYVYLPPKRPTDSLSTTIGATYADGGVSPYPYHIVLALHNLHTQGVGLTIEAIDLFIVQIQPFPSHPLKVWANPNQLVNTSPNLYVDQYSGQLAGESIPTIYKRFHNGLGFVNLAPQEQDQIDIQVVSRREVYMTFNFRISYRMDDSSQIHTLTFPSPSQSFQVAFATADDWHLCTLETSSCL